MFNSIPNTNNFRCYKCTATVARENLLTHRCMIKPKKPEETSKLNQDYASLFHEYEFTVTELERVKREHREILNELSQVKRIDIKKLKEVSDPEKEFELWDYLIKTGQIVIAEDGLNYYPQKINWEEMRLAYRALEQKIRWIREAEQMIPELAKALDQVAFYMEEAEREFRNILDEVGVKVDEPVPQGYKGRPV